MTMRHHTVVPGDTLSAIARHYGVTVDDIKRANSWIENIHLVYPGWVFHIPDITAVEPQPDPGYVEGWGTSSWRDEFDSTTLDPAKWDVWDGQAWDRDWGVLSRNNVFVRDNQLVLRVTQRSEPDTRGGHTRWWDTAELRSPTLDRYGRWEARLKTGTVNPGSIGFWPAWWLRNSPDVGEIDIMESWGSPSKQNNYPPERSYFQMHENTSAIGGTRLGGQRSYEVLNDVNPSADEFHVYALEITPDAILFYFDGELARTVTPQSVPWAWGSTFDLPWHMRLSAQMGDEYYSPNPTPTDGIDTPLEFVVDYVRFWELD